MILAGLLFGFWLRFKSGLIPFTDSWWTTGGNRGERLLADYAGLIGVGAALLSVTFGQMRLYQSRNLLRFRRVAATVVRGAIFWLMAYLSLSLVLKFNPPISRIYVLSSAIGAVGAVLGWRALYHRLLQSDFIASNLRQRVLFIGWNDEAARLATAIHGDKSHPYDVVGCVPMEGLPFAKDPGAQIRRLGDYVDLATIVSEQQIDIAILAEPGHSSDSIVYLTNLCERLLVQFKVIPSYFQILVSGLHLETISAVPILGVTELPLDHLTNRLLKRSVDIVGAIVGLILSAPIIAIFGVLIYWESPGPIFYRQVRTGRRGQNFKIIKLRSMKLDAESKGGAQWAKKNDDRRLRVGAFMRATNIDEVPQFWNVLKGEMSLVGPRPERPELISGFQYQIPHYNARLMSKPGITGWAQVNGLRGDTDLTERVRYDLYYLENWSLMLDFQIMVQTFLSRKNAY
jgi:exopolysaccharide biosynthesis polyprenyl glycosylphosphotransferase